MVGGSIGERRASTHWQSSWEALSSRRSSSELHLRKITEAEARHQLGMQLTQEE